MTTFRISDMTCGGCAGRIQRAIAALDKDAHTRFDIPERLVRISGETPEATLMQAIQAVGFHPEPVPRDQGAGR